MKNLKTIYLLFLVIVSSAFDSFAQSPIYLYLKNGVIETFYPELTDSMTVSNIDEAGNEYEEPVVQKIYSNDSIYVYNLADIDSIGFFVPPTILKPGVIDIDNELINHIIGCDDMLLTLSSSTPSNILPKKGDKLVLAKVTDLIPHGFAGEVLSVENDSYGNFTIDCEMVTLTDIFEQYYSSSTKKDAVSRAYGYGNFPWKPGSIPIDLKLDGIFPIKKLPDVELKAHYHGSFTPDFNIYIEQIISRRDYYSTKVTVVGEYAMENTLELAGEISNDGEHKYGLWQLPIGAVPFITKLYVEAGWTGGGNIKGALTLNSSSRRSFAFSRHWVTVAPEFEGTSNLKQIPPSGRELYRGNYNISGSVEGGFGAGLYIEAGVGILDKRILSVGIRGEIGCEISGQISISQSEPQMESTEFYDNLKENYIKGELYANGAFGMDWFEFGKDYEDKKNPHIKWTWVETPPLSYELFNFSLVPTFSKPDINKDPQYPSYVNIDSEVSGVSLPASIGYAIKDSQGKIVESTYLANGAIWGFGIGEKFNLHHESNIIKPGKNYKIYPMVKWDFWPYCEMIASPSSDFSQPLIIITSTPSQVLASSARIHGIMEDYDSSSGIELGFYYGKSSIINETNSTYASANSEDDGVFATDLKNLKPSTTYYYRACAIIDGETIFADEIQSFTTKECDECNFEFSVTYPAWYEYDNTWHIKPNDGIHFSLAIRPDIPESEDSSIISYGPVIYKNDEEVGSYILNRDDQYLIDGWVSTSHFCERSELEIDNVNYRAVAPSSYHVGVQFEKVTENGDTIVLITKEHKPIEWIYDEKPWIYLYYCEGSGYESETSDPYSPNRFDFSGMVYYQTEGGFWRKSTIGNSSNETLDGYYYCFPLDNISMGHSFGGNYSISNIPLGVTAKWIDINGVTIEANIIPFEHNSRGMVLPLNFEDYAPLKRKNCFENSWPSIYNTAKSAQKLPVTPSLDSTIKLSDGTFTKIIKPLNENLNISVIR